ncbi:YchJ family protein [Flavobacterium aquicola]|uniref:SEC-C motif-containing protein n=1 Tax=Flavobacterium aquicola TaxID=1682742 RepID=A0A3E0EME2_9FLAO|nr:YchJ family metal-binding protein [Flavobacterium aquicola]REG99422.1 SEC-C motif-containing protein [Flavobacterium aquicola]
MTAENCYCGSDKPFESCCHLYISRIEKTPTALALMKSRYAAYAAHQADYLLATTHISERKYYSREEILKWAVSNKWQKLEIISFTEDTVEFKAYYKDENNADQVHYELSSFKKENDGWFYLDGKFK